MNGKEDFLFSNSSLTDYFPDVCHYQREFIRHCSRWIVYTRFYAQNWIMTDLTYMPFFFYSRKVEFYIFQTVLESEWNIKNNVCKWVWVSQILLKVPLNVIKLCFATGLLPTLLISFSFLTGHRLESHEKKVSDEGLFRFGWPVWLCVEN